MGSIYQDQADKETRAEIEELLTKRVDYGWTNIDADRFHYLMSTLKD